ncbi:hypothetical protein [Paenibacillus sp. L3-i20]|uniref:hypothetical protein n=1 Tax=Paenibacillus sp. L3-i20 TaxID=2905833 RepID=UPI001EDF408C|nr:hypothetical protein [Paenibacillus sp. L3-i20]GKU76066.1 hypothetical protein L3i20_v204630 [Paenibacillus sp. L3-i20]
MEKWIEKHIKDAENKFALDDYRFHSYSLHRSGSSANETIYTLSLEWFPNHAPVVNEDEGSNPTGTAVIRINLNTNLYDSVIFVQGESFAGENGVTFSLNDEAEIIRWIERETGMKHGSQFERDTRGKDKPGFRYRSIYNGIRTSPSGSISIELDQEGKLVFYSVIGPFPMVETISEDQFTLTFKEVEPLILEQLQLTEFPITNKKKWVSAYGLEEFYATVQDVRKIEIKTIMNENNSQIVMDRLLEWEEPLVNDFKSQPVYFSEEITVEQVIAKEQHPELIIINESEAEECIKTVVNFMRKVYADQSGQWMLSTLRRERAFIFAELRPVAQDIRLLKRKLRVVIDNTTFEVINMMDSEAFFAMFEGYDPAGEVIVNQEEAFAKLVEHIEIDPIYVYDSSSKSYIFCGRVDCKYGVNATTGEVVELNSL